MTFFTRRWMTAVSISVMAFALAACSGGGGGGTGRAGKPTDPRGPGQTGGSGILPLTLEAVVPPRDVVAETAQTVHFGVDLGTQHKAAKTRFEWSLDGVSLDGNGSGIEIHTGDLAAGIHQVSALLSNGDAKASISWKLQVSKAIYDNRPPVLLQALPPGGVSVQTGEIVDLTVAAADVDAGDVLQYSWLVDGISVASADRSLRIDTSALDLGEHTVKVAVNDGFEHPGETPAEHVWSLSVTQDKHTARPYLTAAWPLGNLRLPLKNVIRFEVEAAGSREGGEPIFRWEVNGHVQASRDPVFDLDTTSDENVLAAGAYRITCSIEEARAPNSLESASIGWTVYLDAGPPSFEPAKRAESTNQPPFAVSILPAEPVQRLLRGESECFQVEARDPDGDILSHLWLVNGTLQVTDGPALTYTVPPDRMEGTLEVEVFASDGRTRPGDEELRAGSLVGRWEIDVEPGFTRTLAVTNGTITLDNGGAGTTATGLWSSSNAAGAFGTDSVYSKAAGATYAYTLQVPAAGSYDVLVWWTSWPTRSSAVPIAIQHKTGTAKVKVDQRVNGGQWNKVGTFDFSGIAKLVITSVGSTLSTCADAVRLNRVTASPPAPSPPPAPPPGAEIVIDDGTAGTSSQGTWSLSSSPNPFGTKSLYAKGSGSYTFSRPLGAPGTYHVYAWWTQWASRDPAAPYSIVHASGTATVTVDQRQGGGKWNLLGRYSFGSSVTVKVSVPGTATVCADAVRFVPASSGSPPPPAPPPPPPPPSPPPAPPPAPGEVIVDNGGTGTSSLGTWSPSSAPNPFGGSSLYARTSGSYTYKATLPSAGTYGVYAWYSQWPSRERAVPYEIHHASGTAVINLDQLSGGGQWNLLGDFDFGATAGVTVRVVGTGTVCADAVRMVLRTAGTPPPAAGLTLAWDAPTKNADGSTLVDLAGFRVYAASGGGSMALVADVGLRLELKVASLAPGTYAFSVTAYDSWGNESRFSSTLTAAVP